MARLKINKVIRAIYKQPGKDPESILIENTLGSLQEAVGGFIETVTYYGGNVVICDEEGRLKGSPYNCTIFGHKFVGPILIVGAGPQGEFTDTKFTIEAARYLLGEGNGN